MPRSSKEERYSQLSIYNARNKAYKNAKQNSIFIIGPDDKKNTELANEYYDMINVTNPDIQRLNFEDVIQTISKITSEYIDNKTDEQKNKEKLFKSKINDIKKWSPQLNYENLSYIQPIYEQICKHDKHFEFYDMTKEQEILLNKIASKYKTSKSTMRLNIGYALERYCKAIETLEEFNIDCSNITPEQILGYYQNINKLIKPEATIDEISAKLQLELSKLNIVISVEQSQEFIELLEKINKFNDIEKNEDDIMLYTQDILKSGGTVFSNEEINLAKSLYEEKYRNQIISFICTKITKPVIFEVNSGLLQPTNQLLKPKYYQEYIDDELIEEYEIENAKDFHRNQNKRLQTLFKNINNVVYFSKDKRYESYVYEKSADYIIEDNTLNIDNAVMAMFSNIDFNEITDDEEEIEDELEELEEEINNEEIDDNYKPLEEIIEDNKTEEIDEEEQKKIVRYPMGYNDLRADILNEAMTQPDGWDGQWNDEIS